MLLLQQAIPAWVPPTMAISLVVIALSFAVISTITALVGSKVLKQIRTAQARLDEVHLDVRRTMKSVRRTARGVSDLVYGEAAELAETSRDLQQKLRSAANRVQDRFDDLDALYEVVYDEVAETAIDVAAGARGLRKNPLLRTVRRFLGR
jgi:predicted PurR-regulated permease PerM